MAPIDPEITLYYERGREAARLSDHSRLEAARTRAIVLRRLPAGARSIVDIGGGPGAYAFWLTEQGHSVTLVDPVGLHLEQAEKEARQRGLTLAGSHLASAEKLPFDDASFDAALFLGPLYHLTEREERVASLREALRVLRPGGVLFAAAISRYGSMTDGFFRDYVADAQFAEVMLQVMEDGQHRNPRRLPGLFTTSYFHRPDDLRSELADAGFDAIEILTIEGIWHYIPDFETKWENETYRRLLMQAIEKMEADPSTVGMGGHLMGVGRRDEG